MQIQETESRYPVKRSMLRLAQEQRDAAIALLERRPTVLPGTRVILDRAEAVSWFREVTATMNRLKLPESLTDAFCDVAGVPD
jgi:hypothetical protein